MSEAPDLDAYFRRIGYRGPADATLATLEDLHARHPEAIPFENLSPLLGEPVGLDVASLERKMVHGGRGGWCFEHNMLFSRVLLALGFDVKRLAARVRYNVAPGVVTPRSHMLLCVKLPQGDYIADVGFGGLVLTAPLALEAGLEQSTPHELHRLVAEGDGYLLEAHFAREWHALYAFEMYEQQPADFEVSNWYLCNHPGSQFVSGILAGRAAPDARHVLRNTRYSIHYPDGATERNYLTTVDDYLSTLSGALQIKVPDAPALRDKLQRVIDANPPS